MKLFISILCIAALGGAALMVGRAGSAGEPLRIAFVLPLLAVVAIIGRWWFVARRRERRKLDEMRDSALW